MKKAAEAGFAESMNLLGALYKEGEVGEPNYTEAVKWFEKAAKAVSFAADWYVKRWNQYTKGLRRIG